MSTNDFELRLMKVCIDESKTNQCFITTNMRRQRYLAPNNVRDPLPLHDNKTEKPTTDLRSNLPKQLSSKDQL